MEAEFEEKEYEVPLYAELAYTKSNIWTPGQVFEGNLGIDSAIYVSKSDFFKIMDQRHPLKGVIMNDFQLNYIWRRIGKRRDLPTFKLNLFLQIKRPETLIRRPANLKKLGLKSPFWRFEVKDNQQKLLEKLKLKLGNRVIVAYGCAAFHRLKDLYSHIENKTLTENSTFVKIERMNGHRKWIYDKAGAVGFAMSEPEHIKEEQNLFLEIDKIAQAFKVENDAPSKNLEVLSQAIIDVCQETMVKYMIADEILKRHEYNLKLFSSKDIINYLNIINFSLLTNTNWLVIDHNARLQQK